MAWRIEFESTAARELKKLDAEAARRILKFLRERVVPSDDPRRIGKPLKGSRLGTFWRYRIGDYRLVVQIDDGAVCVLVLRVAHRREVYRH